MFLSILVQFIWGFLLIILSKMQRAQRIACICSLLGNRYEDPLYKRYLEQHELWIHYCSHITKTTKLNRGTKSPVQEREIMTQSKRRFSHSIILIGCFLFATKKGDRGIPWREGSFRTLTGHVPKFGFFCFNQQKKRKKKRRRPPPLIQRCWF